MLGSELVSSTTDRDYMRPDMAFPCFGYSAVLHRLSCLSLRRVEISVYTPGLQGSLQSWRSPPKLMSVYREYASNQFRVFQSKVSLRLSIQPVTDSVPAIPTQTCKTRAERYMKTVETKFLFGGVLVLEEPPAKKKNISIPSLSAEPRSKLTC